MRRICSCNGSPLACSVHMLWDKFMAKLPVGSHPWSDITPHVAIQRVRLILQKLGVPNANEYGTHDFRRGHAEVGASCACRQYLYSLLYCPCRTCVRLAAHWPRSSQLGNGSPAPSCGTSIPKLWKKMSPTRWPSRVKAKNGSTKHVCLFINQFRKQRSFAS